MITALNYPLPFCCSWDAVWGYKELRSCACWTGRWGIYFTTGLLLDSYFRLQGVSRVLAGARFPEVGHHDPRAQPSPYFCLGGHLFCPAAVASFSFHGGENGRCGGSKGLLTCQRSSASCVVRTRYNRNEFWFLSLTCPLRVVLVTFSQFCCYCLSLRVTLH